MNTQSTHPRPAPPFHVDPEQDMDGVALDVASHVRTIANELRHHYGNGYTAAHLDGLAGALEAAVARGYGDGPIPFALPAGDGTAGDPGEADEPFDIGGSD